MYCKIKPEQGFCSHFFLSLHILFYSLLFIFMDLSTIYSFIKKNVLFNPCFIIF